MRRRAAALLASTLAFALGLGVAAALAYSPQSPVLDSFNRSAGGLGANWACFAGSPTLNGTELVADGSTDACLWQGAVAADQEAYATNTTFSNRFGIRVRSDSTGANTYECVFGATAGTFNIRKVVAGSLSNLASVSGTFVSGNSIACLAIDNRITLFKGTGSAPTTWTAIAAVVDGSIASGSIGISLGAGSHADDFAGGPYSQVGATTFSTTSSTTIYTGQGVVTQAGAYTGQATVTVGGGSGVNCTVATNPCMVDIATNGAAAGFLNNIHDDIFVVVGAIIGAALIALIARWFLGTRG